MFRQLPKNIDKLSKKIYNTFRYVKTCWSFNEKNLSEFYVLMNLKINIMEENLEDEYNECTDKQIEKLDELRIRIRNTVYNISRM